MNAHTLHIPDSSVMKIGGVSHIQLNSMFSQASLELTESRALDNLRYSVRRSQGNTELLILQEG